MKAPSPLPFLPSLTQQRSQRTTYLPRLTLPYLTELRLPFIPLYYRMYNSGFVLAGTRRVAPLVSPPGTPLVEGPSAAPK